MVELSSEQKEALEQQKDNCPFCKIVKGEIPAKKVFENDKLIGVLDINPSTNGHILLMPKEHYPIMPLIPPETFVDLVKTSKELSGCVKNSLLSQGTTIFVANGYAAGQQSTHFMLHIIPREEGDGLDNFNIKPGDLPEEEIEKVRGALKQNLSIMMRNHFQRIGKPLPDNMMPPQKVTKDQILQILEANPQVKTLLLEDTEKFKSMIPTNPQLQSLFAEVNIDELVADLGGGKKEAPKTEQIPEKKEGPVVEEKKEAPKQEPKKTKLEVLSEIIEKNPELVATIESNPKGALEMLRKSKYKDMLADLTLEDLTALLPKKEKKQENDSADLDTIENLFK